MMNFFSNFSFNFNSRRYTKDRNTAILLIRRFASMHKVKLATPD